jgi:transcriptional regulator GlxA family with amidase domain
MLYPGIIREICYWLLTSSACDQIVDFAMVNVHDSRVLRAIRHLRDKFSDQIRVEELASAVGMSPATFHRQFKSVTSMSPLQYQKQLRLLEARRLMMTSNFNVEGVAFEVGYLSVSQFSREYSRMFGKPPRRDMSTCRLSRSTAPHFA